MSNDSLIDSLVTNHSPRKAISRWPFVVTAVFLVALSGLLCHYFFDQRSFLTASTLRMANLIGYFVASVIAVIAAFESGIPGSKKALRLLIVAALIATLSSTLIFVNSSMDVVSSMFHYTCALHTLALSVVPLIFLVLFQKKLAPCNRFITNASLVIAGISLSAIWMSYACPINQMLHLSLGHFFLPALSIFLLFQLVSRKLWRW